jgi:hypothetical protein
MTHPYYLNPPCDVYLDRYKNYHHFILFGYWSRFSARIILSLAWRCVDSCTGRLRNSNAVSAHASLLTVSSIVVTLESQSALEWKATPAVATETMRRGGYHERRFQLFQLTGTYQDYKAHAEAYSSFPGKTGRRIKPGRMQISWRSTSAIGADPHQLRPPQDPNSSP